MSICAHRPETPGFWTPCRSCPCGKEVEEGQNGPETAAVGPNADGLGRGDGRTIFEPQIGNSGGDA